MQKTETQKNNRILVIDDDRDIWETYAAVFRPAKEVPGSANAELAHLFHRQSPPTSEALPDFQLTFASQGKEGVEQIRRSLKEKQPFAVALIDIRMPPGWDGAETAVRIRQLDSNIEFVFVTAYSDRSREELVRMVGSPDKLLFLRKPFDPDELVQLTLSLTTKWNLAHKEESQRQKLKKSEKRFRDLVETTADWVWETDEKGTLTYCSPICEVLYGYRPEELVGHSIFDLCHPDSAPRAKEFFKKSVRNLSDFQGVENHCRNKEGSSVYVESSGIPVIDEDRQLIGFRGINRDVTERRRAERTRKQLETKALAHSKLASLGQMSSGIAHEINQPLSYIKIIYESIQRDIKQGTLDLVELHNDTDEALRQVARITKIINHLRIYVRSDFKDFQAVSLDAVLKDTLILTSENLRINNITLELDFDKNLRPVFGNICQLEQVFINLFQNSIYALHKKKDGEIKVAITTLQDKVITRFSDNGPGIPAALHKKIFEPFFTTKEVGQGTGLGLSTVYGILTEHGGTIHHESRPGGGTTFMISLPTLSTDAELNSTP